MTAGLRFLAGESVDFAIVRSLRAEGHDVLVNSEVMQRSDDRALIHQTETCSLREFNPPDLRCLAI